MIIVLILIAWVARGLSRVAGCILSVVIFLMRGSSWLLHRRMKIR